MPAIAALLAAGRTGDRRPPHLLTGATGAWLGLCVLSCTPYGGHLLTWLLD